MSLLSRLAAAWRAFKQPGQPPEVALPIELQPSDLLMVDVPTKLHAEIREQLAQAIAHAIDSGRRTMVLDGVGPVRFTVLRRGHGFSSLGGYQPDPRAGAERKLLCGDCVEDWNR